jgi:hypothetical protein
MDKHQLLRLGVLKIAGIVGISSEEFKSNTGIEQQGTPVAVEETTGGGLDKDEEGEYVRSFNKYDKEKPISWDYIAEVSRLE